MGRKVPIFYSALLLTGVNLLLRMAGTTFQVYLSGRIGAAGIGLLQLTMSVSSLAMVAGVAGVRTAAMYLTAEEFGKGNRQNISQIISGCFVYSILCSSAVSLALYCASPLLASRWIGDLRTAPALRVYAAMLPAACLCAVMTGCFTAAGRIGTLAAVEVAEQLCAIAVTMALLTMWAKQDAGKACLSVVLGGSAGTLVTLSLLVFLYLQEKLPRGAAIPLRSRIAHAAVPLAIADVLRSGISTTENLLVPKRLARFPGEREPLAAFGMVSGMVFPIMMFPACILFGLAELLIPEMARCAAGGKVGRIRYLTKRSLKVAMLYGIFFGGMIHLLAQPLCRRLYHSTEAGVYLALYAFLIPVLYCDAITDAMTKGLGQQKICVRYNILTSSMDVGLLFLLLPIYGMKGYYFSFLVTHALNFVLSLRLLIRITQVKIPFHLPALAVSGGILAVWIVGRIANEMIRGVLFPPFLLSLLTLFQVVSVEDLHWLRGLLRGRSSAKPVPMA